MGQRTNSMLTSQHGIRRRPPCTRGRPASARSLGRAAASHLWPVAAASQLGMTGLSSVMTCWPLPVTTGWVTPGPGCRQS